MNIHVSLYLPEMFDAAIKAHTNRTRFRNATQFFNFQKQIKQPTKNIFGRNVDQIAEIVQVLLKIGEKCNRI